jgi:tRNA1Val (adenine37-N6)-methyltransferase
VYADLVTLGGKHHLYPIRCLSVTTKPGSTPKRVVATFSFTQQSCENETLLTEISRHQYSEEYIALTRDYYLNM